MTKQEFFTLPTNKATVKKLQEISTAGFSDENLESFESKNWVFFGEVAGYLKEYLSLPKKVKQISSERTTEKYYNEIIKLKENGYRQNFQLPFE